jgi:AcrR family transcriptional regulator
MSTKVEKSIYKAFFELYRQKNIDKISVKEICFKAGVSRVTFYTYFEDIHSLLREIEEKIIADSDEIFKTWQYIDLTHIDNNKPLSILVDYYTYMHNNLDIFWVIYNRYSDPKFFDRYYRNARKWFINAVKLSGLTVFTPEILTAICIDGFASIEKLWVSGKIKATPVEFALMVQKIIIAIINCDK